jgi:hypothetical protein
VAGLAVWLAAGLAAGCMAGAVDIIGCTRALRAVLALLAA